jgi:hypothetical protein
MYQQYYMIIYNLLDYYITDNQSIIFYITDNADIHLNFLFPSFFLFHLKKKINEILIKET